MSEENFKKALSFLFPAEGGYNNDPDDHGGPTNMGVTQTSYNAYRRRKNLPYNDVKNITQKEAVNLYYEDYWKPSGADEIEDPNLSIAIFDTSVLHGVGGARTIYKNSNGTLEDFLNLRQKSYDKIVADDPSQKKYYQGWNNRVNDLRKKLNSGYYTNNNSSTQNPIQEESTPIFYGQIETDKQQEMPKEYGMYPHDPNRVYTFEELPKMKPSEFLKNQSKILSDFVQRKIIREEEARAQVQSGELIYVQPYQRSDGTEVKGYYRRR